MANASQYLGNEFLCWMLPRGAYEIPIGWAVLYGGNSHRMRPIPTQSQLESGELYVEIKDRSKRLVDIMSSDLVIGYEVDKLAS